MGNSFCILLIISVFQGFAFHMSAQSNSLAVTVDGFKSASGSLFVAIHNSAATFLSDTAFREVVLPVKSAQSATFEVADLPPGAYAICLFHDVNGNGRLDTNLFGIPSEPYGFSNNARGRFGPPRYTDAVFVLSADLSDLKILLR